MRSILIACAALGAVSIALPVATASAQTVVIKKDGDHDRGLHRGWRHNNDWRHHNAKVVVIKKHRRHDD
jgi:hypothetical protein